LTLTCEERERRIFDWLFSGHEALLRRYSKPERLSEDQARLEVTDMVTDINGRIPTAINDASLDTIFGAISKEVRRRHGAQHWPTVKVLLAATRDAVDATAKAIAPIEAREEFDPLAVVASRIAEGRAVSDTYLYGRGALDLIDRGLVTEEQLEPSRKGLLMSYRAVWGATKAQREIDRLETRHRNAAGDTGGQ